MHPTQHKTFARKTNATFRAVHFTDHITSLTACNSQIIVRQTFQVFVTNSTRAEKSLIHFKPLSWQILRAF
jgi:hypothetical protein